MKIPTTQCIRLALALLVACLLGLAFYDNGPIIPSLKANAYASTEQLFGSESLAPEQEAKVLSIASEMGVYEPFHIRKMNRTALSLFGYHNAFAYFPTFFNVIPIRSTPFLFISEGLFEDLTPSEQRFLIGHELVHIQERHTEYLNVLVLLGILYFLSIWWRSRKQIRDFVQRSMPSRLPANAWILPNIFLLYCCFAIPNVAALAYRRQLEWHADRKSLEILKSYDGCIQFMNRLECEFHVPTHNDYFGLIADHPSCTERKNYCETLKNNAKDTL